MSDIDPQTDPLAAAARLEASMDNLAKDLSRQAAEVSRQDVYGRQNRHLIWGLIVSAALNLLIGGIAIYASLEARSATSQAERNRQSAIVSCEAGNESRRLGEQLWTYVLDLSEKNPKLTPQQKKQIAQFRGYIKTVYAPRDCSQIK